MPDDRDPVLDAMLSEVLGGHTPPDLAARILQTWAARGIDPAQADHRLLEALAGAPIPPPLATESTWLEPVAPPVQLSAHEVYANGHPTALESPVVARKPKRAHRKASKQWISAAVAASLLVGGSIAGYAIMSRSKTPIAEVEKPKRNTAESPDKKRSPRDTLPELPMTVAKGNGDNGTGQQRPTPEVEKTPFVRTLPKSKWADAQPTSDNEILAFVNDSIRAGWKANKVEPSATASDADWCRRAFSRLIGRAPTAEELASFSADKSPGKRALLVDRLINHEQYAGEFAQHFAAEWTRTLIGPTDERRYGAAAGAEGLRKYLADAIAANQPYDQIARDLIAATGSSNPASEDYNAAANFLLAHQSAEATSATAHTARAFLGQQVQCAQCHDHPLHTQSQQQYWAMNSFFRQMQVERRFGSGSRLVNRDLADGTTYYTTPGGETKSALPALLDGTPSAPGGLVSDVDRRAELAALVAASDDFSRAMVNRTWAQLLGFGFTRPVDDMGAHNPPTHPEVLDRLAKEFKAHKYDVKSLARWIALAEPFGLSSKPAPNNLADAPSFGTPPLFSHYYARPAQPAESVHESLFAAVEIAQAGGTPAEKERARVAWLSQVSRGRPRFGETEPAPSILSPALVQPALTSEHMQLIKRIAASSLTTDKKIEHLFLSAVARPPSARELDTAQQVIRASRGDANEALRDIWWALLNSQEFSGD